MWGASQEWYQQDRDCKLHHGWWRCRKAIVVGNRIDVKGALTFKKKDDNLYFNFERYRSEPVCRIGKQGWHRGRHGVQGKVGKDIDMKKGKMVRLSWCFSAFSAEDWRKEFAFTWVRFVRFSEEKRNGCSKKPPSRQRASWKSRCITTGSTWAARWRSWASGEKPSSPKLASMAYYNKSPKNNGDGKCWGQSLGHLRKHDDRENRESLKQGRMAKSLGLRKVHWVGRRTCLAGEYNGMNALLLTMLCEKKGYELPVFCTFNRAVGLNYQTDKQGNKKQMVDAMASHCPRLASTRREEFSVMLTSFTIVHKETKEKIPYDDYKRMSAEEQKEYNVYPKLNVYQVFNVAQTNLKEARPELYAKLEAENKPEKALVKGRWHVFVSCCWPDVQGAEDGFVPSISNTRQCVLLHFPQWDNHSREGTV